MFYVQISDKRQLLPCTTIIRMIFMTKVEGVYCAVRAESLYETYTDVRRLTTGLCPEECVVRRFCHRANVIECTHTNLDSTV